MEYQSFGNWLKLKRKALNLTRDSLAERVGYSAATLRKIEDEERRPSVEVARRLADVFSISADERESFLHFARGDANTVPSETTEDAPWHAATKVHRSNIPATTTSLISRQLEIAQVREYLSQDDVRLVTLMGPPGIGKTRLSIETARAVLPDFADGVFFVALALLDDPNLIPSAIIRDLGYMESGYAAPMDQLKESIGGKQMLIVLDNCEHLIDEVTSIASGLLSTCPRLKMLATSRESFRIPGEWLYPVPAFDLPKEIEHLELANASDFPALTLFAERARAVQPSFKLTSDNIPTIAEICAHLDGLPLGIELIAARMRVMSPRALLERLSGQFVLAADGRRAVSERQKTLRNAIDWSYQLLSTQEQKLFAYLSVFTGGFTLQDAEAIFGRTMTEKSVPELLALLLDKSLIQRAANEWTEDRFQMLVTIQDYARECLLQTGEEAEVRNWHLAYFLELAERANPELYGHQQIEWLDRLSATRDNLRAGLDWAIETEQTQSALDMARKLDWFWFIRSEHVEAAQFLLRVLQMPEVSSYPEAHAEILAQLQHHKHVLGNYLAAQLGERGTATFAEQALAIARAHNDAHNSARALAMIGLNQITLNNFVEAQSALEESRKLFQAVQDEWGDAYSFFVLGYKRFVENDLDSALPIMKQAYEIFKKLGERLFTCVALRYIGITQIKLGNIKQGLQALRDGLTTAQQLDSKYEMAAAFYRWGQAAQYLGDPARTVTLFWAAKNAHNTVGMGIWTQGLDDEFETVLERCRAVLGEAAFAEAVERGRAMTMEQAITYALEDQE